MAKRRFEDTRKLGKVGKYSYCVTIPREIIRELGWQTRQRLNVALEGNRIVISDWEPRKQ